MEKNTETKGQGKQGKQKGRGGKGGGGKGKREQSPGQVAHQMKKSRFNTFVFEIAGSKALLMALVRQPSFHTPARLRALLEEWQEIKQSPEYQKLKADSVKKRCSCQRVQAQAGRREGPAKAS